MNPKAQSDSATQNPSPSPPGAGQAPSVPISVYRELAAELQATRAMLDAVHSKNQQLTFQNQQLRQEVDRLVHSALTLQQLVEPMQPSRQPVQADQASAMPRSRKQDSPTIEEAETASTLAAQLRTPDPLADALFTEEPDRPQQLDRSEKPREMGGLWLTLTVLIIIVTAFGAGFLVVKPLLPSR